MSTLTELETVIFDLQSNIDKLKSAQDRMKTISNDLIRKREVLQILQESESQIIPIELVGCGFDVSCESMLSIIENDVVGSIGDVNKYLADFKATIHDKS